MYFLRVFVRSRGILKSLRIFVIFCHSPGENTIAAKLSILISAPLLPSLFSRSTLTQESLVNFLYFPKIRVKFSRPFGISFSSHCLPASSLLSLPQPVRILSPLPIVLFTLLLHLAQQYRLLPSSYSSILYQLLITNRDLPKISHFVAEFFTSNYDKPFHIVIITTTIF